jgi:hypothetical protein
MVGLRQAIGDVVSPKTSPPPTLRTLICINGTIVRIVSLNDEQIPRRERPVFHAGARLGGFDRSENSREENAMAEPTMSAENVRAMLAENLERHRKASADYFEMLEKNVGSAQLPIGRSRQAIF